MEVSNLNFVLALVLLCPHVWAFSSKNFGNLVAEESPVKPAENSNELNRIRCEFFDSTCIQESGADNPECARIETCAGENDICYAVWKNEPKNDTNLHKSGHNVKKMGCISNHDDCFDQDKCLTDDARGNHFFCCCQGDLCNSNFKTVPKIVKQPMNETELFPGPPKREANEPLLIVCVTIGVAIVIIVTGIAVWFYLSTRKSSKFDAIPAHDQENGLVLGGSNFNPTLGQQIPPNTTVEISCPIGKGKYGNVYKGKMGDTYIALKIFPLQGKQSWIAEKEIYNIPQMDNHDNVLKFLGVDQKYDNLEAEFWLATEYHNKGSLHDFLKANTVGWDEMCKIAFSIGAGLTFLHEELPENGRSGLKPSIAHRDFKSKNVLIKSDMTACIADFGLALVFRPGQPIGDAHGQVGTVRYMAPEVLEGAINFTRDAFLKIDMYACGLVLWELASRCNLSGGQMAPNSNEMDYKLPFEAEANNPQLDTMQDLVVNRKVRPTLKESWRLHPGMAVLCDTIEECWDHDTEARLSASCVMERVRDFRSRIPVPNPIIATQLSTIANHTDSGMGSTTASTQSGDTDSSSQGLDPGGDTELGQATEMTPLYILNKPPHAIDA